MKRILVCAESSSWHFRDLVRAGGGQFELVAKSLRELAGEVTSGRRPDRDPSPMSATAGTNWDAVLIRNLPLGSLQQVVLRMDILATWTAAGIRVVNPPAAMECAVDKFLSLSRLSRSQLPVPRTFACQTVEQAHTAWHLLHGNAVLKPLFGSEGRGLMRLTEEASALALFEELVKMQQVIYLQEYISHSGWDLRMFVVGDRLLAMKRENPNDWRLNATLGARVRPHQPSATEADFAFRAAAAVGASIAGVDLIYDRDMQPYLLEVNGAPGWRYLSGTTEVDVAGWVLDHLVN